MTRVMELILSVRRERLGLSLDECAQLVMVKMREQSSTFRITVPTAEVVYNAYNALLADLERQQRFESVHGEEYVDVPCAFCEGTGVIKCSWCNGKAGNGENVSCMSCHYGVVACDCDDGVYACENRFCREDFHFTEVLPSQEDLDEVIKSNGLIESPWTYILLWLLDQLFLMNPPGSLETETFKISWLQPWPQDG